MGLSEPPDDLVQAGRQTRVFSSQPGDPIAPARPAGDDLGQLAALLLAGEVLL